MLAFPCLRSPSALVQLERELKDAKQAYADSMSALDAISQEIHMKRAQSANALAASEQHAVPLLPKPDAAGGAEPATS